MCLEFPFFCSQVLTFSNFFKKNGILIFELYSAHEWCRRQMDGSGKQTQSPRDFQETMDPFYTAKPLFKGELVRDYQVEIKETEF